MNCGKIIYGKKMIIEVEKNTVCYTSELGHKNFWYPTNNRVMLKKCCNAEKLPWIGGGNMVAIKILKSCLMPISLNENTVDNTSPPSKNNYTVVWIQKNK